MISDFTPRIYSTETCYSFTVNSNTDTSWIDTTITWTSGPSSINDFIKSVPPTNLFSAISSSLKNLVLTSGAYSLTHTCAPSVTIVPSTPIDQNYDLSTMTGSTTYTVPAFTLSPPSSPNTITYTDLSSVVGVSLDTSTRIYNWASLTTLGTYTLTI